jgi:hypothetical protein
MARMAVVVVLLVALLVSVPGCGFLLSKFPKVKIQPPDQSKTTGQQSAAESKSTEDTLKTDAEVAPSETVVKGSLPEPADGDSSSGGTVRYEPIGAQRTLSTSDLSGLSKWQLDVLRNEIYAAHGRTFERSDLQNYFDRQTWYTRDSGFSEARLSSLEKRNAEFIAKYQKGRGQVSGGSTRSSGSRRSSGSQWVTTGFVLPFSSDRNVTSSDLSGLSKWELDVARNEIYARHGRGFNRSDLREYFNGQAWYSEDSGYSDGRLSRLEARNAEYIRQYQR